MVKKIKKTSIEMETVVKLIIFLFSVIVVFSIFKLVISKIFTNIGLEMCSISFSLEKKAQDTSWIEDPLGKTTNIVVSSLVGLGCSAQTEEIKVNSEDELLMELLFKLKKICDVTARGYLNKDKVLLYVIKVKPLSSFRLNQYNLLKLRDAYLLTPTGKMLDLTLADYCNNVIVNLVFNDFNEKKDEKSLFFEDGKLKVINIYYEKKDDKSPNLIIEI